jgi:hypothetical protein
MNKLNFVIIFILGILVLFCGGIGMVLATIGGSYADAQFPSESKESFIIHLAYDIAKIGWYLEIIIIIGTLFGMSLVEFHKKYKIKFERRVDVKQEVRE